MADWVYEIKSDIPWADVTEEPDTDEATTAGQQEQAAGNHTVSGPIEVDANTRRYTLTFDNEEAWNSWCDKIKAIGNPNKSGFTSSSVQHSIPEEWLNRPY